MLAIAIKDWCNTFEGAASSACLFRPGVGLAISLVMSEAATVMIWADPAETRGTNNIPRLLLYILAAHHHCAYLYSLLDPRAVGDMRMKKRNKSSMDLAQIRDHLP